jgi:hypothetical protein
MATEHEHEKGEAEKHEHGHHEEKNHTVVVTVNEQPVKLHGEKATGAQIKAAAIAQGVQIQQNFVLQEELPNGKSRVVGDNDERDEGRGLNWH